MCCYLAVKKIFNINYSKGKKQRLSDEEMFRNLRDTTNYSQSSLFHAFAQVRSSAQVSKYSPEAQARSTKAGMEDEFNTIT